MEGAAPGPHQGPTHTLVQQGGPRRSRMLNCARARAPLAPVNPNIKTSRCRKARMRELREEWKLQGQVLVVVVVQRQLVFVRKLGKVLVNLSLFAVFMERVPPSPPRPGAALKNAHKAIAMEVAAPGPHQGPTHTLVQQRGPRRSRMLNCARARAPVAPVNPNMKRSWCRKARIRLVMHRAQIASRSRVAHRVRLLVEAQGLAEILWRAFRFLLSSLSLAVSVFLLWVI